MLEIFIAVHFVDISLGIFTRAPSNDGKLSIESDKNGNLTDIYKLSVNLHHKVVTIFANPFEIPWKYNHIWILINLNW